MYITLKESRLLIALSRVNYLSAPRIPLKFERFVVNHRCQARLLGSGAAWMRRQGAMPDLTEGEQSPRHICWDKAQTITTLTTFSEFLFYAVRLFGTAAEIVNRGATFVLIFINGNGVQYYAEYGNALRPVNWRDRPAEILHEHVSALHQFAEWAAFAGTVEISLRVGWPGGQLTESIHGKSIKQQHPQPFVEASWYKQLYPWFTHRARGPSSQGALYCSLRMQRPDVYEPSVTPGDMLQKFVAFIANYTSDPELDRNQTFLRDLRQLLARYFKPSGELGGSDSKHQLWDELCKFCAQYELPYPWSQAQGNFGGVAKFSRGYFAAFQQAGT